jgi:hypothetical protein
MPDNEIPPSESINLIIERPQSMPLSVDLNTALMAYLMYSAQVNHEASTTRALILELINTIKQPATLAEKNALITFLEERITNHTNATLQRQNILKNNTVVLGREQKVLETLLIDNLMPGNLYKILAKLYDCLKLLPISPKQVLPPAAIEQVTETIIHYLKQHLPQLIAKLTKKDKTVCFIKPPVISNLSNYLVGLLQQKLPASQEETAVMIDMLRKQLMRTINHKIKLNNTTLKKMTLLSTAQTNAMEDLQGQILNGFNKLDAVKQNILRQLYTAHTAVLLHVGAIGRDPNKGKNDLKVDLPRYPFILKPMSDPVDNLISQLLQTDAKDNEIWSMPTSRGAAIENDDDYQLLIQPIAIRIEDGHLARKGWQWFVTHYTQTMFSIGPRCLCSAIESYADNELINAYLIRYLDGDATAQSKVVDVETRINFLVDSPDQATIIVTQRIIGISNPSMKEKTLLPPEGNVFSLVYVATQENIKLTQVYANSPALLTAITEGNPLPWLLQNAACFIGAEANALARAKVTLAKFNNKLPSFSFCDTSQPPFADIRAEILYWLANAGTDATVMLKRFLKANANILVDLQSKTIGEIIKLDGLRTITSIFLGLCNTKAGGALLIKNPQWLAEFRADYLIAYDQRHHLNPIGLTALCQNEYGPQILNYITQDNVEFCNNLQAYLLLIFTQIDKYDAVTVLDIILLLLKVDNAHQVLKPLLSYADTAANIAKTLHHMLILEGYPYKELLKKLFTCDAALAVTENLLQHDNPVVKEFLIENANGLLQEAEVLSKIQLIKFFAKSEIGLSILQKNFEKNSKFFDFILNLPLDSDVVTSRVAPLLFDSLPASAGSYKDTSLFCWLANQPLGVSQILTLFNRFLKLYGMLTPTILMAMPAGGGQYKQETPALFQFACQAEAHNVAFASILSLAKNYAQIEYEELAEVLCTEYTIDQSCLSYLTANIGFHPHLLKFVQILPQLFIEVLNKTRASIPPHQVLYKHHFDNWVYGIIPDLATTEAGKQILLCFMHYRPSLIDEIEDKQIKDILKGLQPKQPTVGTSTKARATLSSAPHAIFLSGGMPEDVASLRANLRKTSAPDLQATPAALSVSSRDEGSSSGIIQASPGDVTSLTKRFTGQ